MVKQNQGFKQDLNLEENINDTQTLNNIGGAGIANDLRIIQNNLRNTSSLAYNSLSDGYFFFGSNNEFVFTNDDVVTVSVGVNVGITTLVAGQDYYVCNSDGRTRFKLSTTPSTVGVSTILVSSVSPTNFNFIRKDPVYQENIINFIQPEIQDTDEFSYFNGNNNINSIFNNVQTIQETAQFFIDKKFKGNADTTTNNDINIEGSVIIEDPAQLNTGDAGLADSKSPGIFIGGIRAFSSDNNPWTKVGTALSTISSDVSIGELYFEDNITISGIGTEVASQVAVTSFTHKLPVIINNETYYILLGT